jgi:hypothetical protein
VAAQDQREHLLSCFCEPLVGGRGPVRSTINLGMSSFFYFRASGWMGG